MYGSTVTNSTRPRPSAPAGAPRPRSAAAAPSVSSTVPTASFRLSCSAGPEPVVLERRRRRRRTTTCRTACPSRAGTAARSAARSGPALSSGSEEEQRTDDQHDVGHAGDRSGCSACRHRRRAAPSEPWVGRVELGIDRRCWHRGIMPATVRRAYGRSSTAPSQIADDDDHPRRQGEADRVLADVHVAAEEERHAAATRSASCR